MTYNLSDLQHIHKLKSCLISYSSNNLKRMPNIIYRNNYTGETCIVLCWLQGTLVIFHYFHILAKQAWSLIKIITNKLMQAGQLSTIKLIHC